MSEKRRKVKSVKPSIEDRPAGTDWRLPYETIDCSLTLNRVQREVQLFCMEQRVSHHEIGMGLELRQFEDLAAQQMVRQLIAKVASKKYDVKTVKFPNGPWQFIKFNLIGSRWYGLSVVRKFLQRYPVKYVEVTMEANAYHPDVAIPDRATFVEIIMQAKYDGVIR
jgi:hypothetical protein